MSTSGSSYVGSACVVAIAGTKYKGGGGETETRRTGQRRDSGRLFLLPLLLPSALVFRFQPLRPYFPLFPRHAHLPQVHSRDLLHPRIISDLERAWSCPSDRAPLFIFARSLGRLPCTTAPPVAQCDPHRTQDRLPATNSGTSPQSTTQNNASSPSLSPHFNKRHCPVQRRVVHVFPTTSRPCYSQCIAIGLSLVTPQDLRTWSSLIT